MLSLLTCLWWTVSPSVWILDSKFSWFQLRVCFTRLIMHCFCPVPQIITGIPFSMLMSHLRNFLNKTQRLIKIQTSNLVKSISITTVFQWDWVCYLILGLVPCLPVLVDNMFFPGVLPIRREKASEVSWLYVGAIISNSLSSSGPLLK